MACWKRGGGGSCIRAIASTSAERKPLWKKTQRLSRKLARSSDEDQGVRKRVIAGNWKMHMTCAQARDYMASFLPLITDLPDDRTVVLAPPFTAVSTIPSTILRRSTLQCLASSRSVWRCSRVSHPVQPWVCSRSCLPVSTRTTQRPE